MKNPVMLVSAIVSFAVVTFSLVSAAQPNRDVTVELCRAEHSSPAGDFVTEPRDTNGDGVADTCVLDNYFGSDPGVGTALKKLRDAHPEEYQQYLASEPYRVIPTAIPRNTPPPPPTPNPTTGPDDGYDPFNWFSHHERTDALTGDTRTAVTTRKTVSFDVVGGGFGSDANLLVRCTHTTGELEVYISFRQSDDVFGDYIYVAGGFDDQLDVTYKFDDGPLRSEAWGESVSNEAVFQQKQNTAAFVQNIRKSEHLTIRVTNYRGEHVTIVFNVKWFDRIASTPSVSTGNTPMRGCL